MLTRKQTLSLMTFSVVAILVVPAVFKLVGLLAALNTLVS